MTVMMFTKILIKLKQIILFLLPLSYIGYILYFRLIFERNSRILFVPLSISQIIFTCLAIILLIWRIHSLLKKLGVITKKEKTNKLFALFGEIFYRISGVLNKLWIDFVRVFTYHAKSVTINLGLLKFIKKIQIWQQERFQPTLYLILIFQVLPRVINLIAFLTDIFYFQEFFYFYKTLGLLLLPLIYSAMASIIQLYYDDNMEGVRDCLVITKEEKYPFFRLNYKFADDFECPGYIKGVPDFVLNHYIVFLKIRYMLTYIETVREYFYIYWILLGISVGYLIGWSAILFFGIAF